MVTEIKNQKHKIIVALRKKGYTGITIYKYNAQERLRGFVLISHQIEWKKLGACLDTAMKTIDSLPEVK